MNAENLRETLRRHAGDAPPSAGLLDAVRARSRRRRRHRQVTAVGAAVVAVALALTAPVAVRGATDQPAPPGRPAATSQPPLESQLVAPPDLALPDFPFTPGWTPPEAPETVYSHHGFGMVSLAQRRPDGVAVLWADVNLEDPDHTLRSAEKLLATVGGDGGTIADEPVTVQGRDGVLSTATSTGTEDEDEPQPPSTAVVVTWLHEPGLRVGVFGDNADDVLRYAEELTEEPFPAQTPFTFDLMPPGVELDSMQPSSMTFYPEAPPSGSEIHALKVELLRGGGPGMPLDCPLAPEAQQATDSGQCPLPREPVQVGEHAAELIGDDMVVVYLEDGLALSVAAAGVLALSHDDLLRFAAGVHVTEYAAPFEY